MKLCINCENYNSDGMPIVCSAGHWISTEQVKTKTFNPIMFECFDYESSVASPCFGNDTFFGVFTGIMK